MKNISTSKIFLDAFQKLLPRILAVLVFAIGAGFLVFLFLPLPKDDIVIIRDIIPVEALEATHLGAISISVLMILIARGLWERIDSAWYLAIGLFVFAAILSLIHGFEIGIAGFMLLCVLAMIPCKPAFNRRSQLAALDIDPIWLLVSLIIISFIVWLGFFVYEREPYTHELWTTFTYEASASRFLRGLVIIALTLAWAGVWHFISISRERPKFPEADDFAYIKQLVEKAEDPQAWLALMGDKHIFWNDDKDTFLMYGIAGKFWIVLNEPIGNKDKTNSLVWDFKAKVSANGGKICFYNFSAQSLPLMIDLGLSLYKIGEEAIIDTNNFNILGRDNANFRNSLSKLENLSAVFEFINQNSNHDIISELREISNQWLVTKKTKEKAYSLGSFDDEYIKSMPIAIVKIQNQIVAFANIFYSAETSTMTIDMMRYSNDAPKRVMEYLFLKLIEYCRLNGIKNFSLGMAPLSGFEASPEAPAWAKLFTLIYKIGSEFYDFEGLRAYKEKFKPNWQPRYLAVEGRDTALLSALLGIVKLGNKK